MNIHTTPIINWMTHIVNNATVKANSTVVITSASGLNCLALLNMFVEVIGLPGKSLEYPKSRLEFSFEPSSDEERFTIPRFFSVPVE